MFPLMSTVYVIHIFSLKDSNINKHNSLYNIPVMPKKSNCEEQRSKKLTALV